MHGAPLRKAPDVGPCGVSPAFSDTIGWLLQELCAGHRVEFRVMDPTAFRDEVLALHEYLSAWLTGRIPQGGGRPARLERALADDFVVIHPNGSISSKTDAVDSFAAAWNEKPASYALRVDQIRTRMVGADHCLVTYDEWHDGEPGRARISTALLRRSRSSDGVQWLFLQETPAPHLERASV